MGNVIIIGTATTLNTEHLYITDNIITLNSNVTGGTPTLNSGIESLRGDQPKAQLLWDELIDKWTVGMSGNMYSIITSNSSLSELGSSAHTHSISEVINLQTSLNNKTETSNFNSHTADTTVHFTKSSINLNQLGSSAHTHTISEVINLQTSLDNKTETSNFNSHTADTTIHFTKSSINLNQLGSSAHTHNTSDIIGYSNNQFTGGTVPGYTKFTNGLSADTYNGYTWPASDGLNGQILSTNGSKVLSWTDKTSSGTSSNSNIYIVPSATTNSDMLIWNSGNTRFEKTSVVSDSADWGGFTNNSNINVTYDPTTRKISLSGSFKLYWEGQVIIDNSAGGTWTSTAHSSGVTTTQYLYYNDNGFQWSNSIWQFEDVQIAAVAYTSDGTQRYTLREVHGFMPPSVHRELHTIIGTYLSSGADIGGYTLNSTTVANRRPTVSQGIVYDEDLMTTLPTWTGTPYTQSYLSTASSTTNFVTNAAEIVPVLANNPYYNFFTSGAWTQTLMSNNSYMCVWLVAVPVAASTGSQTYRYIWVQGQSNETTLGASQALTTASINLGNIPSISPEYVFVGKVIIRYNGGNWTIVQVDKLTGSRYSQSSSTSSGYLSSVSVDGTTITGNGTVSSPLVAVGSVSGNYLPISGGTVTGDLQVLGNVSGNQQTSSMDKIINGINLYLYNNYNF